MDIITNIDKLRLKELDEKQGDEKVLSIDDEGLVNYFIREKALENIIVYNAGKGCYIIMSNDGKTFLVDAGTIEVGQGALVLLQSLGVQEIECVFITHYHYNHIAGIPIIGAEIDIKQIISNGTYSDETREPYGTQDPLAEASLLSFISSNNIPYSYTKQGDSFTFGDLVFKTWSPLDAYFTDGGRTADPNGMTGGIYQLIFKDFDILFGGDINKESELLEIWDVQGDVSNIAYAWPHHGDPHAAIDSVINPMNLKFAFIEDLGGAKMVMAYLDVKGIEYEWIIGNLYTGIVAYENGTFDKFRKKDFEYEVLELSCKNQTELNLGIKTFDDSAWTVDFGDGNKEVGISSVSNAYNIKYTYSEPFTGSVRVLFPIGGLSKIDEIRSSANGFNFDVAIIPNNVRKLDFSTSTIQEIYGVPEDLPTDLEYLKLTGQNKIIGDIGDFPINLKFIYLSASAIIDGLIDNAPRKLEYIYLNFGTNNNIGGDIGNAPPNLKRLDIQTGSAGFGGLIDNAPRGLIRATIQGTTTLGGDIGNAPPNIEHLYILEQNIGGLIENAPNSITYLRLKYGNGTSVAIGGDIGLLPDYATTIQIEGPDSNINSYTRRTWVEGITQFIISAKLSQEDLDNLIIDLSNTSWSGSKVLKIDSLNGVERSSASDSAVAVLQGKGVNVIIQ